MDATLRKLRITGFFLMLTQVGTPPPAYARDAVDQLATVNVRSCLYLRVGPQYRSRTTTCVSGSTDVRILGTSRNGYSQVEVNGRTGYLFTRYLKRIEAPVVLTRGVMDPPSRASSQLVPPVRIITFQHRALWGNSKGRQAWTEAAVGAIRSHWSALSRARDLESFCPGFRSAGKLEQENCLLSFIGAVVKFESGFNARTVYSEGAPLYYNSVGLFQLSHNRRTKECKREGARSEADLKNPILNIKCGIRIMASLVARYGRIGGRRGAGAYWSVLRLPGEHRATKTRQIANLTKREFRAILISSKSTPSRQEVAMAETESEAVR